VVGKHSNPRLNVLFFIVMFIFIVLISRLSYLQIAHGADYMRKSDSNRIRLMPLAAPRGVFYDRNGVLLVSNRPGFTVSLIPILAPISDEVINRLGEILNMSPDEIQQKIKKQGALLEPIRIKNNVNQDVVTKIEENRNDLPGVVLEIQSVRNYIYNQLGAHIFGYLGEISESELEKKQDEGYKTGDIIGKFGLEKVWDKEIRGTDGGTQEEIDATGSPVEMLAKKAPIMGNSLVLTIDVNLQKVAEKAMDDQLNYLQKKMGNHNAKAAAAVVMNPQTGEILAMVSRPAFDPNFFNGGISVKKWNDINNNPFNPMENRVIAGEYPPGSTFKIVTSTAAFELGKLTPEEKLLDSGHYMSKGNAMGEALGWIDFKTALAKSNNVFFYQVGERVGIDDLAKYAQMYGLGSLTGIKLPDEATGLVASKEYKKKTYQQDWYLAETLDAAIGQGFQLVTPLQIAMVMSEVANGGHQYRPYLVKKIISPNGDTVKAFEPEERGHIDISDRSLNLLRDALHGVTLPGGTAGDAFKDFPVSIAAKTGTAENSQGDDHGWFVAYAPFDNPTIVVAAIVEHGGFGSDSATPIAKKILAAAFNVLLKKDAADELAEQEGGMGEN